MKDKSNLHYRESTELKIAMGIIEKHREDFIRRWNEWFD
jgi:hypothetical protein